jgi:hypothetical protein
MKRILFTAVFFTFLLALSSIAVSIAEEVDGFRGMRWGTPIAEIIRANKLVKRQDDGKDKFVFYSMENDNLRFGGVNAASIRYFFWRNKFAGVVIVTTGELDFNVLKVATDEKFGLCITGIGPSGEEINSWDGEVTVVSLSHDTITSKGKLVIFSKTINELKEGLEAEKAGREVERDF